MHIAVNLVGDNNWMGGVLYVSNLLHGLNSLPEVERSAHRITLVVYPDQMEIKNLVVPLVDDVYYPSFFFKVSKRFPANVRRQLGFLVNPKHFDFMFPVLEPFGYPFPNAGWIPDFQHLHLPHFFEQDEIRQTETKYRAIAQSPLVVLSSKMAQDDFAGLYPERASNGRVLNFVSYADPAYFEDDPIAVQSKYDLPDVFFLVSNQFWAHKNHEIVVDAVAELGRNGVKAVVVCTGKTYDHRVPGFFDQLLERIKEAGISDQFKFLGLIPRIDQMNLMRRSLAVIQPSLFEGWSTVVEDARALGKSLIISDFPVHLEQNPRYSWFFPRNDATALAERMYQAIHTLLPGPDYATEEEARNDNLESMRIYARNFLAIAAESVGMAK